MKQNVILSGLAVVITVGITWWITAGTANNDDDGKAHVADTTEQIRTPQVGYMTVRTEMMALPVSIHGRLKAENRLELFPEVPGKIREQSFSFREGVTFEKGDTLLQLDDEEARFQLRSNRSRFIRQVSSILPDLKLDYPDSHSRFENWYNRIDPGSPLPPVPDIDQSQLRKFLASRGIYESYYQIKSAEERIQKYAITAPFSGVISKSVVDAGQTVSPQTHLGTLTGTGHFELTASVRRRDAALIQTGDRVNVRSQKGSAEWEAVVSRINPTVDLQSQQVSIYLNISGSGLREGMYLEGTFNPANKHRVTRIPKSALLRTNHVYAKQDGIIEQLPVDVLHVERSRVWVSGLRDGTEIIQEADRALGLQIIRGEQQ